MYETYIMVKHGGFSWFDIQIMPIFERRGYIDIMMEENRKVKEHRDSENSKNRK